MPDPKIPKSLLNIYTKEAMANARMGIEARKNFKEYDKLASKARADAEARAKRERQLKDTIETMKRNSERNAGLPSLMGDLEK